MLSLVAAATTTSVAAAATIGRLLSLISETSRSSLDLETIEVADNKISILATGELDDAVALRAALLVLEKQDLDSTHLLLHEDLLENFLINRVVKVADEDFVAGAWLTGRGLGLTRCTIARSTIANISRLILVRAIGARVVVTTAISSS